MADRIILYSLCILLTIIIILTAVVVIRTRRFRPALKEEKSDYKPSAEPATAKKLAEAVSCRTVSHLEARATDWGEFTRLQELLEQHFPLVHSVCTKTVINGYSLSYHWKAPGSEPAQKPILITAHMDVVPVEEETSTDWTYPAFDGLIRDGFVWGRGTLDIKIHMIAALEAVERLIKEGFTPSRDIYLAFGHDEEIDGMQGAARIAEYYAGQGLRFDYVLDEGGFAARGLLEGIEKPIALVGTGEKGFANIRLNVTSDGGHSSMPARHSSLGILAQALCRLEKHTFKPRLIPSVRGFLLDLGPHMKGINRVILANLWLFKPLFLKMFSGSNMGGALLKTTVAVTMASGSPAPNIIPQKSSAVINCRILPGETGEDLMNFLKRMLKGLPVELEPLVVDEPSKISPADTPGYRTIGRLIKKYCGDAIVVPYLVMASTDARKYEPVCDNIYRFTPYLVDSRDTERIHGTNERISIENVNRCVDFFVELLKS